jgi:hypothetical protein
MVGVLCSDCVFNGIYLASADSGVSKKKKKEKPNKPTSSSIALTMTKIIAIVSI